MTLPPTHSHLALPPLHPALEPYRAAIESSVVPAWLLRAVRADSAPRESTHFGGNTPYVPADEGWPPCSKCDAPLDLVWQIDFSGFAPGQAFADRGLFQLFYCWECFPDKMEVEEGMGVDTRWYPEFNREQAQGVPQVSSPRQDRSNYAPCSRAAIEPFLSLPDFRSSGAPIPESDWAIRVPMEDGGHTELWEIYDELRSTYTTDDCYFISQVGGHPHWVKGANPVECPECGREAEFVGAIGSDDSNIAWEGPGYFYIWVCKATERCRGLDRPSLSRDCV